MTNDFLTGCFHEGKRSTTMESMSWQPHPTFEGVHMKTIATGEQTEERLSCHLIRIDPGKAIGRHSHPDQIELHIVVGGSGSNLVGEVPFDYRPGVVALIPKAAVHEVRAGAEGLLLIAEFTPASH